MEGARDREETKRAKAMTPGRRQHEFPPPGLVGFVWAGIYNPHSVAPTAATHLREHQVKVALERVAEAGGVVVAVALEHVDQVDHHVGQLVHGAGHVLDQHGCAGLARRAHNGDQALR